MIVEIPKVIKQIDETLIKDKKKNIRDRHHEAKRQLKYWHHHITMTLLEKAKKTFDCVDEQSWNELELTEKSTYDEKRAQQREAQEWYDAYQEVRDDPQYQLYASYIARIKMRFSENNTISSSNSVTLFQQEENVIELSDQSRNVHPSAGGLRRRVFS